VCLISREVENKLSTDSLWYTETAFLMVRCDVFYILLGDDPMLLDELNKINK